MKRFIVCLLVFIFIPALIRAGFLDQEPEKSLPAIVDSFYNLELGKALEASLETERRYPGHPAGPFYRSIVYYQSMQTASSRLESSIRDLKRSLKDCLKAAKGKMKEAPALAHYYEGACSGFQARMHVAQGEYFNAVKMARKGAKNLKKALEMDPSIVDAYFGLGMYHYYMDRMPAAAKPFAYLLVGMWGNREHGLEELQRVAQEGGPAKMEARTVLASIYATDFESQWMRSEELLAGLMERYPGNPRYRLMRLYVSQRRQDWPLALMLANEKDGWVETLDASYRDRVRALLRYREAETLLMVQRAKEAEEKLQILDGAAGQYGFSDWVLLRQANLLDFRHERPEALKRYKRIKDPEARSAAKIFIKEAYPNGAAFTKPYTWPLVGLPEEK